jgi:hypothetical protein
MSNQSDKTIEVFDPLLDRLLARHAMSLLIIAPDGTTIGDLLANGGRGGSMRLPEKEDWIRIPPRGIVSTKCSFVAGDVPNIDHIEPEPLPPGRYFLEFCVHDRALSGLPAGFTESTSGKEALKLPSYEQWQIAFPGQEIGKSKRIELQLVPRTGD